MSARYPLLLALAACSGARSGPSNVTVSGVPAAPVAEVAAAAGEPSSVELAVSATQACVRLGGRVHCTDNLRADVALAASPPLAGIEDAVALAVGKDLGCVATRAGKVLCFGANEHGQLGAGLRAARSDAPVPVSGVTDAVAVYVGDLEACAALKSGGVRCWGANPVGQTGGDAYYAEDARDLVTAEPVPEVRAATRIAVGKDATCLTTHAKQTWCFGNAPFDVEEEGSLHVVTEGASAHGTATRPRLFAALAGLDDLATSGANAFCGVKGGEVRCWGRTTSLASSTKGLFARVSVTNARQVRLGADHACALLGDGHVSCWGASHHGVLGRKATSPAAPDLVPGVASATALAAGGTTTCTLSGTTPTTAQCWGQFPGGEKHLEPATVRLTR